MLEYTEYDIEIKFITEVLGTAPQKDIAEEHLSRKYVEDCEKKGGKAEGLPPDELETYPEELEKGSTAFHRKDGQPTMIDYQIKGFFKNAGMTFNGHKGVKALKSKIEKYVFPKPRFIPLEIPEGGKIGWTEMQTVSEDGESAWTIRPLRAMTAQGPRVGIARSETLPAGTKFSFCLKVYDNSPIKEEMLRDLLSYGEDVGFLQWRNGGMGRFEYTMTKRG